MTFYGRLIDTPPQRMIEIVADACFLDIGRLDDTQSDILLRMVNPAGEVADWNIEPDDDTNLSVHCNILAHQLVYHVAPQAKRKVLGIPEQLTDHSFRIYFRPIDKDAK